MSDWRSYATHLECSATGETLPIDRLQGLSPAGKPLLVRYDLDAVKKTVSRDAVAARPADMWRWRELLPVREARHAISLGEVETPLIALERSKQGATAPIVKDEGRLPTGSFKARGLCMAMSMAHAFGVKRVAIPTNGNAGAAMVAYASRVGIESFCFCPEDTPEVNVREIALQGGRVWRVNGLINDCGKIVREGVAVANWFDISTLKEPYRIEGKKTMGLELALQFGFNDLPDVVFYPTGGGTGLIGMWKAWQEMQQLGWIQGKLPRLVAVQADTCAPIVKAYNEGKDHAELWQNAHTIASGIRVPAALGDFLILDAVRKSGGFAAAVSDAAIEAAVKLVAREDGLLLCPEGAATYAAYADALASKKIAPTDKVVLFNCASGLKYPMPPADARLDLNKPIDYAALLAGTI
jgi:threonine synthase